MTICDIDHLHKRFLDIWEWCMRQGFDTRAFTYVENAFKSEPTAEVADHKTEPTISKMEQVDKDINVRSKTENNSEKPNNCEDLQDWKDRMWAEAVIEPQTDCTTCDQVGRCERGRAVECPLTDCAWK